MKASDLQFYPVSENPGLACNTCGANETTGQWRMADIPIHDGKDTACIVVCSQQCEADFVNNSFANLFIRDLILKTEAMARPTTDADMDHIGRVLGQLLGHSGLKVQRLKPPVKSV